MGENRMQTEVALTMRFEEACTALGMKSRQVVKIVELGIIAPRGSSPEDWRFDFDMISTARRAQRLRRDLHIDWSAVALVLDLLQERDRLQQQNALLEQRLQRFLSRSEEHTSELQSRENLVCRLML